MDEIKRLEEILETMDIPKFRSTITSNTARWLMRNIRVRNSDHPDIEEALSLLKVVVKRYNKQ